MIQEVTKGIRVSVKTSYDGTMYRNYKLYYTFNYYITIENTSEDTVQLTHRYWKIFDSLNKTEVVAGEGVVGQTPILTPNDQYTYKSGCILESNMGAMSGYFTMVNIDTSEAFQVTIPTFQLIIPVVSN